MAKPKQRSLEQLYKDTRIISKPKITPVLRGSCRMQGPVDEVEDNIQKDTIDQGFSGPSKNQKLHLRKESGTCNVCFAPCSSCLHVTRALMGSKAVDFSGEPFRESTLSFSVNFAATSVRACEVGQRPASETSNLMSLSSSHDSLSENAESKANLRSSDVSGVSEDVEISPKLSSGQVVWDVNHSLKPKMDHVDTFADTRALEGHDDNLSCGSGANILSSCGIRATDRMNQPGCSASTDSVISGKYGKVVPSRTAADSLGYNIVLDGSHNNCSRQNECYGDSLRRACPGSMSSELSSHHASLMRSPSSNDLDKGALSRNLPSMLSNPPCVNAGSSSKDITEDSCSHLMVEPAGCSGRHSDTLVIKKEVCHIQKSASYNCDDYHKEINHGNSQEPNIKLEAGSESELCNLPEEDFNALEQNKGGKAEKLLGLPDGKESSLQSHHGDDSDESDFVEQDVKVCDICGDAGREDLLAICCRCTDGAEHTYCMRVMVDKVPEGDWFCEECKSSEEIKNSKREKSGKETGIKKDQSSGQVDSVTATGFVKFDKKGSDDEGNRNTKGCLSQRISGKRLAAETEVSSAAKRQALESIVLSPRTSSPSRLHTLSSDSSVKELESGKTKATQQVLSSARCSGDQEGAHSPTTGPRLQTLRGSFVKSNSFNFSNPKPKLKVTDEVVLQKQNSIKEPAPRDAKEGVNRGLGKSMSFKSINSGRSSANEPKVKMLSPNFSHAQDLKALKNKHERNFLEKKNSFKSPRPLSNSIASSALSSMSKIDKKIASRGDSVSFSSKSNHELKAVQNDSKSISIPKGATYAAQTGAEATALIGESKRHSSCSPTVVGVASSTALSSSFEQKPVQSWLKDDSFSISNTTDDGVPGNQEPTSLAERNKEGSTNNPRKVIAAGMASVPCQKCKEIGHTAQFCTVESPGSLGLDASAVRNSKEVINRGSKLKAAIEAAMLKKPSIYRKSRMPDQSDQLCGANMNNEVTPQDKSLTSSGSRTMISVEEVNEEHGKPLGSSVADYSKLANGNSAKKFMMPPPNVLAPRTVDGISEALSDRQYSGLELSSHDTVIISALLKMSAIPDHEYIWQGSFEIHRSGKASDVCDGFQAHLSTSASPRVIEAVNKLPCKVVLNEVPRLSVWPIQFEESGVREDNIALYFFAKDVDSYDRSYKILLDAMMRDDLALKGSIDGDELLIFPSNQLPEKSHRWNMLFFLWGVFRGKRKNSLSRVPSSPDKIYLPPVAPTIQTARMSIPENICSTGSTHENLPIYEQVASLIAPDTPAVLAFPGSSSPQNLHGDRDPKVSSLVERFSCPEKYDQQDSKPFADASSSGQLNVPERRRISIPMDADSNSEGKVVGSESGASALATHENLTAYFPSKPLCAPSNYVNKVPVNVETISVSSLTTASEENAAIENRMNRSRDILNCSKDPKDEGSFVTDCDHMKRPYVVVSTKGTAAALNDVNRKECASKKQKVGLSARHCSYNDNDEGEETAAQTNPANNSERFFFPLDPIAPWTAGSSSSDSVENRYRDRAPSLELALGGEMRPSTARQDIVVGKLDRGINLEDEPPAEEANKEEEDVAASLSLSLSFPFLDDVSRTEQRTAW